VSGAWPLLRDDLVRLLRGLAPASVKGLRPACDRLSRALEREQAEGHFRWYNDFDRIVQLAELTDGNRAALRRAREAVGDAFWHILANSADLRADPAGWPRRIR
jgi:hypothetical protein